MSVKDAVLEKVAELPDDASVEIIKERVNFVLGFQETIESTTAGHLHSAENTPPRTRRWAQAVPGWEGTTIAWDDRESLFDDHDYRDDADS